MREIEITKLFTSPGHDFFGRYGKGRLAHGAVEVDLVECVAGKGILGDRFFEYKEDYPGQITFLSQEVIAEVKQALSLESIDLSAFRRNAIVSGVDLNDLIGLEFDIGGITFFGAKECSPCFWMDEAIGEGTEEFLKGRGGLRCRILSSGTLKVGKHHLKARKAR